MKSYFNSKTFFLVLALLLLSACADKRSEEGKFYGNVDVRTLSLAFQVSGKLNHLYFDEGEKVKKGELVATLDDALFRSYLNQINAQIEGQKAILSKLKKGYRAEDINKAKEMMYQKKVLMQNMAKTFKRNEKLYKQNTIAQEKYDNIKTEYESAKALYLVAKSNYELLKQGYQKEDINAAKAKLDGLYAQKEQRALQLQYTKLYAPTTGTILTKIYEEGSVVNASSPIVEMAKEDEYWVRSYMSEKYLGRIKSGMKANIETDSNNHYEGVVSFISPVAEFTPKSVQTEDLRTDLVYRFRIVLTTHDEMIKQGMPVTITFPDLKTESK